MQNTVKTIILCGSILIANSVMPKSACAEVNITGNDVSAQHQIAFMLGITPRAGFFGLQPGVFYNLPLLTEKGLAPKLRDSFYIEMGAYLFTYFGIGNTLGLIPMVGPRWSLHLTDKWDVFATLKLGAYVVITPAVIAGFGFNSSLGAHYMFSDNLGAFVEIGVCRAAFQIGISSRF